MFDGVDIRHGEASYLATNHFIIQNQIYEGFIY